jgi:hypothetical protein
MTRRRIRTLDTLRRLADEVQQALDDDDLDIVASLLWDLAFKAAMFALRHQGTPFRRTWTNVRSLLPTLRPVLGRDYSTLLAAVKDIDRDARYAEDEWECDDDDVRGLAKDVLELVDRVCNLAP